MNELTLNPRRITRLLVSTAIVLVLASMVGQLIKHVLGHDTASGLITLFYVDAENNIPSFFSAALLLTAACLLAVIATLKRQSQAADARQWTVLAFIFLFLSIDEAASIHELLTQPTRRLLGDHASGVLYFAWVVPGMALVLAFALSYLKLFLRLPVKTRTLFFLAAAAFVGGAIGMELVGGWFYELHGDDLPYSLISTVEESLEMTGSIVFIYALLDHLAVNYRDALVRLDSA